jgi:hypothetical protein
MFKEPVKGLRHPEKNMFFSLTETTCKYRRMMAEHTLVLYPFLVNWYLSLRNHD